MFVQSQSTLFGVVQDIFNDNSVGDTGSPTPQQIYAFQSGINVRLFNWNWLKKDINVVDCGNLNAGTGLYYVPGYNGGFASVYALLTTYMTDYQLTFGSKNYNEVNCPLLGFDYQAGYFNGNNPWTYSYCSGNLQNNNNPIYVESLIQDYKIKRLFGYKNRYQNKNFDTTYIESPSIPFEDPNQRYNEYIDGLNLDLRNELSELNENKRLMGESIEETQGILDIDNGLIGDTTGFRPLGGIQSVVFGNLFFNIPLKMILDKERTTRLWNYLPDTAERYVVLYLPTYGNTVREYYTFRLYYRGQYKDTKYYLTKRPLPNHERLFKQKNLAQIGRDNVVGYKAYNSLTGDVDQYIRLTPWESMSPEFQAKTMGLTAFPNISPSELIFQFIRPLFSITIQGSSIPEDSLYV